jgi:hypothetical protein
VTAASAKLGTLASSVTAAVGESNVQAATARVSSLGVKTREAVSSTVSFLEEKGIVSGAQGLAASAGATAKSVFSFAQSGVIHISRYFYESFVSTKCISGKVFGEVLPSPKLRIFQIQPLLMPAAWRSILV